VVTRETKKFTVAAVTNGRIEFTAAAFTRRTTKFTTTALTNGRKEFTAAILASLLCRCES
jgi:hypothetical protein